ncbi:MAG: hypothetical protein M0011_01145 [Elusimicrobia bacterium]|nr:hypothetical protein [Elusimicrobiota bacterium]
MDRRKEKLNSQLRLIAALKEFTGPVPAGQFTQKEFFIVKLQIIGDTLEEFKREKLAALVEWVLARMARGPLSEADSSRFRDSLSQLVSGKDYAQAAAGLGTRELLAERLSRVTPVSASEEEKKRPGEYREPSVDKLTSDAYARMRFEDLEKEFAAGRPVEELLNKARERVAGFCAVGKMPLGMDNTMPSPMMTCIEAVVGACYRLLARLKR